MARKQAYRVAAVLLCTAFAVASCGSVTSRDKRVHYDGVPFKTSAKALNKKATLADFQIVVKDALRSPKGARLAVVHEATTYCIENYGSSDILWPIDPMDEEQDLRLDGGDAVYQGMCDA